MKILATIIIMVLSFEANADRIQLSEDSLTHKLTIFLVSSEPLERELIDLENKIDLLYAQHGRNYSGMGRDILKELVGMQRDYAIGKQEILNGLSRVYINNYRPQKSLDDKLNFAIHNATKNCRLFDKLASNCLNKEEVLVFQAHYLNLHIQELVMLEDSLLSQIHTTIQQENGLITL